MREILRIRFGLVVGCWALGIGLWLPQVLRAQLDPQVAAKIEALAEKVRTEWNVPGLAVAVVSSDMSVWSQGFGTRRLGQTDPVDADTLFAIASNTKAFVTASLAVLVEQGKLRWDDPVADYLPELKLSDPVATQQLTVRDLVCHRSGLGTFSGDLLWYETTYSPAEILQRARHLRPVAGFRSSYGYQNLMFIAAGQVVQRVSGMPCSEFVRRHFLVPLGMQRTTTSVSQFGDDNVAMPHNASGGTLRALPHGDVDNSWGACGLNSSVSDLSRWIKMHLNRGTVDEQTLIPPARQWEMWQPYIFNSVSEESMRINPSRHFLGYGLGWVLWDFHGRKLVGHSGGLDGMISQIAMVPEERLGVVVLTNSESPVATILRDSILEILLEVEKPTDWHAFYRQRHLQGEQAAVARDQQIDAARIVNAPPTLPLSDYCGNYRCPMYGEVAVELVDGKLVMKMIPSPNLVADLEPWHYNCFEIRWRPSVKYNFPRGFVNFTIDARGQTHQLKIDQPNDDFWFYELNLSRVPAK